MNPYRLRRTLLVVIMMIILAIPVAMNHPEAPVVIPPSVPENTTSATIADLDVKGRAPKTGYSRNQFGSGWGQKDGCDLRNIVLKRDLTNVFIADDGCKVVSGELADPYTGSVLSFIRGPESSDDVQIDHVVALSNAWQTGAQQLTFVQRTAFANDPLNLLAVDGPTNEKKSDGDAATWLPPNKPFRCQYVQRQVSVKRKYGLWVTPAERDAILRVMATC